MRYRLIVFFLISSIGCLNGQTVPKPVHPAKPDKPASVADYERLIKRYRYANPDSATYFAQKGIALARRQKDSVGVAMMLVQMGMMDDNQGNFDDSDKKYQRALAIYRKAGSAKGIATATIRIGIVDLRNGKYDKAVGHFINALTIAEASRDTFGMMEATYSISWAHLDQHHYDQALHYLSIAERLNDRLDFSNITLNMYNNFGVAYRQKKNYKKAEYYLKKGVSLSNAPEYQGLNITLINNLASVYAKENLKEKAIALQEEALLRSREIHNYLRELQTLSGLARTYGEENPAKAIFYFRQAVLLAREKKAYKQEMRFLKELVPLYKVQGNYREALLAKEREHALADSFFYKDMSQHIEALKSDYELSKSKARINALTYINKQNRLELEKSVILRNVTFVGVFLLLVILGLFYNQYRIKQQKSKEIGEKNKSLQLLVEEKEWLLKEIHHRVKNNLQIVSSLLHSQGVYLKDRAAQAAIRESQNRVHAMALIHQKLYQSDRLSTVPMADYIEEIVDYLLATFDSQQTIRRETDVEPIELDVIQAVLIGLIINESVTNSLKYAFPHRSGIIHISLNAVENRNYLLMISDDGVGLPADFNPNKSRTLGMSLIRGLSKQLGGNLQLSSQGGLQIRLLFVAERSMKPYPKAA